MSMDPGYGCNGGLSGLLIALEPAIEREMRAQRAIASLGG